MSYEFKLPAIGEGVAEGEVVKWLVKPGDTVSEDQPIVEIMTDKATVEIASPRHGTIEKLLFKEGDVVQVGKVLASIAESGAGAHTSSAKREDTKAPPPLPSTARPSSPPSMASMELGSGPRTQVLASPATRKRARELGIDLQNLRGSGAAGRVMMDDLGYSGTAGASRAGTVAYMPPMAQPKPAKSLEFGRRTSNQPKSGEERVPLRGIRKKIAQQMVKSKFTAPHYTHVEEADATELVSLKEASVQWGESRGIKLTYLPFIVKAVTRALREFPAVNARLDDEKGEIVYKHFYNIGIAVATANAELVVPVIKNADQKSIVDLSKEIAALGDKARSGRLAPEDLSGGTFTITSMGPLGGVLATPIINYPEVAIMGFHKIRPTPVVRDGQIVVREMVNISLSADHRVLDGAVASSFLAELIRFIEQPGLLMLDV